MKKQIAPTRKLSLKATTLRRMTDQQLLGAAGGLRNLSSLKSMTCTEAGSCVSDCWCDTDDC
jgi:hypothetical protein